jgi:tetratricopeptide (TPR) repeat protein
MMTKKKQIAFNGYQALAAVLLAAVGFIIYSNTLNSPFVFDDIITIEDNSSIRMTEFSVRNIVTGAIGYSKNRPISMLSFAFNYYFGRYNVVGYHLVNILIHIANGVLLFFLLEITRTIYSRQRSVPLKLEPFTVTSLSFCTALLWLAHPVQTQSVTYIVQRMNSMGAMFYILALFLYAKGRLAHLSANQVTDNQSANERQNKHWHHYYFWHLGCALAAVFALGSKESTVSLPFFIFLYEWYFFQNLNIIWLKKSLKYIAVIVVLFGLIAFIFLGSEPLVKLKALRDFSEGQFTMGQRLLTQTRVVVYYLSLLGYPHPSRLNLDYDFPLSYSLMNPSATLLSLTVIIGLIILGVYLAKKERLISFSILWFFGNLVIESSVIPLALIFEHRLYLPSMLLFLIPVTLGHRYIKLIWLRAGVFCLVIVVLCVWTYQRNRVWENDLSLWADVVKKSPNKVRSQLNLGLALANRDRLDEAISHYLKSIQLDPNYAYAYNNLGVALKEQGKLNEAIQYYRQALQIDPTYVEAINNLAGALEKQGQTREAAEYYRRAIELNPKNDKVHTNMGHVLVEQGKLDEAIEHYRKALQLNPNSAETLLNWGDALAKQGKTDQAINHFHKALQIDPDYAEAHNNLGGELLNQGKTDEALEHLSAALDLNPNLAEAHSNMGVLLIQKGKFEAAISYFREALRLNPNFSSAEANLKKAEAIQKRVEAQTERIHQALNTNPNDPVLYFEMGNIYLGKGEFGKAIAEFEKALSIQPQFAGAQYNLALAYAAAKQYDEALKAFKKMVALQPDNPNTYYNIAALQALQNNVEGSIEWLKKAIDKGYQNWEIMKTDKDLENIRNSEEYRKLIKDH